MITESKVVINDKKVWNLSGTYLRSGTMLTLNPASHLLSSQSPKQTVASSFYNCAGWSLKDLRP